MAIKIGKYYITQNNPRELLRERAELINILDEIREYIKEKAKEDEECVDIRYINFGEGVDYDLLKILDKVKQ